MPTSATGPNCVLDYADSNTPGTSGSLLRRLPMIGACVVALSFAIGSCGGFFGNPGFPDDVRLLGALGVLIGAIMYVAGRIGRERGRFPSARLRSTLTATIPLVCVALVVPFRMPSVFVSHPLKVWSLYGAQALVRYRLTDDSVFGASATLLVVVAAGCLVWRAVVGVVDHLSREPA